MELDAGNGAAAAKAAKLEPVVTQRREKMKEEMIGACYLDPRFLRHVVRDPLRGNLWQMPSLE